MAAATVVVKELNGGTNGSPATYTTCGDGGGAETSYFRVSDAHGSSSPSHRIPIPASGVNYSYWKSFGAEITANGDSNRLDNWKTYLTTAADWATGGKVGTQGGLKIGYSGSTYGFAVADYDFALGQTDSNGWAGQIMTAHGSLTSTVTMPTSATEFSDEYHTSTGSTKHFVSQLDVDTDATLGTIGTATLHIQYDES